MTVEIKGYQYRKDDRLRGVLIRIGPQNPHKTREHRYRCAFCGGRVRRYLDTNDPLRCSKESCRTLQSMEEFPSDFDFDWNDFSYSR
jgi:hypothetical protein